MEPCLKRPLFLLQPDPPRRAGHALGRRAVGCVLGLWGALGTGTTAIGQCQYEVATFQQDCPFPFPPAVTNLVGLNNKGQGCGSYTHCFVTIYNIPFVTEPNGQFTVLPFQPGIESAFPSDLNDDGLVVGRVFGSGLASNFGFAWQDGEWTILQPPPQGNWSEALACNNAGLIAGYWSNTSTGLMQACLWQDGELIDLGPVLKSYYSLASDVNELGHVTGWIQASKAAHRHAFLYDGVNVIDLGPVQVPGGYTSEGAALNDLDQVVGYGRVEDLTHQGGFVRRAFLWNDGIMTELGMLPGYEQAFASDISNDSQIIGHCEALGVGVTAFLWSNGVLGELTALISDQYDVTAAIANSINAGGQIACLGGLGPQQWSGGVILTPAASLEGDLTGDCEVDEADLGNLIGDWGARNSPADFNNDGTVDGADLGILLLNWDRVEMGRRPSAAANPPHT